MVHRFVGLLLALVMLGACGTGRPATTTLAPLNTPGPTSSSPTPPIDTPTPETGASPSVAAWPAGWDGAFCTAFAEIVIAQQLARDIGRALAEEDRDDAIGLAHELATTVEGIRPLLADLPEWDGAEELLTVTNALLGEDEQLVLFYLRFLEQDRPAALDRALEVETTLHDESVPAVEAELNQLAELGLGCPDNSFDLDTP